MTTSGARFWSSAHTSSCESRRHLFASENGPARIDRADDDDGVSVVPTIFSAMDALTSVQRSQESAKSRHETSLPF
jgi:hypothetical protein